jgi:hypothetical protein
MIPSCFNDYWKHLAFSLKMLEYGTSSPIKIEQERGFVNKEYCREVNRICELLSQPLIPYIIACAAGATAFFVST